MGRNERCARPARNPGERTEFESFVWAGFECATGINRHGQWIDQVVATQHDHHELGGSPAHLGTVGVNYYWTNQWDMTAAGVPLADEDPRRVSLHSLIESVWKRYGTDLAITETSHIGDNRCGWLREAAREVAKSLDGGIPLRGICIYPVLGMPEWHDQNMWTRMGLWDLEPCADGLERRICEPMRTALEEMYELMEKARRDLRGAELTAVG